MMSRLLRLIACIAIFASLPAYARTFSDDQGQSVEGEFVRMTRGRAVISVGGGKFALIPFGRLIPADQEFVRKQLESRGQADQAPARPSEKLGPERTWTDTKGRTLQARFLGIDNGKIILQAKGKPKPAPFPFKNFSKADQEYVRKEMAARGEGNKVPKIAAPPANAHPTPPDKLIAQVTPSASNNTTPKTTGSQPQPPSPPATKPTGTNPAPKLTGAKPQPAAPPNPKATGQSPLTPPSAVAVHPLLPQDHQAAPPQPRSSASAAVPAPTIAEKASAPIKVRKCSRCGEKLPENFIAGDYCPKCGVYLQYEDTANHGRIHAGPSLRSLGIPAGIASLIYVAAVAIVRYRWQLRRA